MSQAKKRTSLQKRSALSFADADGTLDIDHVLQTDVLKDVEKFEETIAGQVQNVLNEFRDKLAQTPANPSKKKQKTDKTTAEKIPKQPTKKLAAKSVTKNSTKNLPGTSSASSTSSISTNKQDNISKTKKEKEKDVSIKQNIPKTTKNLTLQSQHDTDNTKETAKKSSKPKDKDNTVKKSLRTKPLRTKKKENVQNIENISCSTNITNKVSINTHKKESSKEPATKKELSKKNMKQMTEDNTVNKSVGTITEENMQSVTNINCLTNVTNKVSTSTHKERSPKETAKKKELNKKNMKLMMEDNTVNKSVETIKKENMQNVTNKVLTSTPKKRSAESAKEKELSKKNMKLMTEADTVNKSVGTIKKENIQNVTNISCLTTVTNKASTSTSKEISPEETVEFESENVKESSKILEKHEYYKKYDNTKVIDTDEMNLTLQEIEKYFNSNEDLDESINKTEFTNKLREWNINVEKITRIKESLRLEKEQTDEKKQCKRSKQIAKALKELSQHMAAVMKKIHAVNIKSEDNESDFSDNLSCTSSCTSDSSYSSTSTSSTSTTLSTSTSTSTTSISISFSDSDDDYSDQSRNFRYFCSVYTEEDLEQYNSCTDSCC
ncbi:uncharacterized protein DDB_G0286299-like [Linepithema humile]|uniref:uncharacterized protein DDB_G0286299-like n=1 Tax=Linepithema humile TaxID=83485 RepID=UPI00062372D5|nr:PREDICTED: muscle M-line assembly protein unc-89-like [Linepithema humile]